MPLLQPQPECGVKILARVTAAAFGQRRKMLRQSLKSLVPDPQALLAATGLSATSRAEELCVSDFGRLAYALERWPGTSKRR
jgi:16S rRNA (adenine1518-N6/adenine1519-N6)-dimethyltransferase